MGESRSRTRPISPAVNAVLDDGTSRLRAAGFSSRSAFLTSSTFGGLSWLAHSTLQSGLWVDNQQRYDDLLDSDRLTLASAFKKAGWRTVDDVPSNTRGLAGGRGVLSLRQGVRRPERRLSRSQVQLCRPCPTSTPCRPSNAWSLRRPTAPRSWRRSTSCRATPPGHRSPGWSSGARSVTAPSSTACRLRASHRTTCGATPIESRPPSGSRSSTRWKPSCPSWRPMATTISCSSSSAITNPPRSSVARTRATTYRSRSSPTTRPSWTGSPAGVGRAA